MALLGKLLGWIRPDFAECGMIMRRAQQVVDGRVKIHRGDDFVDQFRSARTDDCGTQNLAAFFRSDDFHESVGLAHEHRFAVVVEGITRDAIRDAGGLKLEHYSNLSLIHI